ncbi:hypothetical protein GLAREA_00020 [Glarea lozoyensis ATCC 20868]|uniref:Uncharacterized protein n=1 Tax=Glarea lozoyensis (strain ATCC 20868 / MF5171) TaxID=1116229 RepID=S3CQZ7_GLAL2|nr:uncharacterized protein GLAREA_00020 [Glarea lozoyensis ATCC 20868]EPE28862.1 hypothetical protein GLAREA_00020 [Glarea lozoyensis ATCC 20868]
MSSNLSSPSSLSVTPLDFQPAVLQTPPYAHNASPSGSSRDGDPPPTPQDDLYLQNATGLNRLEVISPRPVANHQLKFSHSLLQTPPGTKPQRQDGYFTARAGSSPRSTQKQTSPASDDLNKSTNGRLSPILSSGGSSCHSCDSGNSPVDPQRLSPPPMSNHDSCPPYKPRSRSSVSLTMMPRLNRSRTMPLPGSLENIEDEGERRRHRHRRHRARERLKQIKAFMAGSTISRSSQNSYDAWRKEIESSTFFDQKTASKPRRWSSFHLKRIDKQSLPMISEVLTTGTAALADAKVKKEEVAISLETDRKLSLTIVDDLVGTIRQMMTMRKVISTRVEPLEPPASITLRRASTPQTTTSSRSSVDRSTPLSNIECKDKDKAGVKHNCPGSLYQRRASGTYLITNEDIEAITKLVDKQIQRRKSVDPTAHTGPPIITTSTPAGSTIETSHDDFTTPKKTHQRRRSSWSRRKSVRKPKGTEDYLQTGYSARTSQASPRHSLHQVMFTHDSSGNSDDEMPAQFDFLHKGFSPPKTPTERSRNNSQKSMHEVIWKPPNSQAGSPLRNCKLPETSYFTSEPVTPLPTPAAASKEQEIENYLEAVTRTPSFFPGLQEWPPTAASTLVPALGDSSILETKKSPLEKLNKSDSEPARDPLRSAKQKKQSAMDARRRPRLTVSETRLSELADVISFPPLPPRKTTNDWHTPLPAIEMAPKPHGKHLYDLGLDIHCGHSGVSSTALTPRQLSYARYIQQETEEAPRKIIRSETLPLIEFKGAIQIQPKAPSRTSVSPEIGHSIDTCPANRKTSSADVMRCVTTVDNARKSQKTSTWIKVRPPSVCPSPQPPTPTELRCDLKIEIPSNHTSKADSFSPESVDRKAARLAIIQQKMPQTPEVDRVGIYGRFTGTGSRNSGGLRVCPGACEVAECHHCSVDTRDPSVDWIS